MEPMNKDGKTATLRYLALAREVAAEAARNADPDDCMRILRRGVKDLGYSRVGIWIVDPAQPGYIRGTWGTGWNGEEVDEHGVCVPVGDLAASRSIVAGENVVLRPLARPSGPDAPAHGGIWLKEGPTNCASIAIRADDRLIGILSVDCLLDGGTLDDHDTTTLGLLADIVAVAIARGQAVQSLAQRETRFRLLIESTSDVYLVLDPAGIIRYASDSIERVFGYTRDQVEGKGFDDFLHPSEVADAVRKRAVILSTQRRRLVVERRFRTADGRWRYCEAVGTNCLDEPAVQGIVVTLRDRTERHQLEEQLRQIQKMEAIGRLAGGVAHDFNNLLTVVNGYASLLRGRFSSDSSDARAVEHIRRATENAARLTRQLLAFSRRQFITPKETDLNQVVEGAVPTLRRLVGEDVSVRVNLAPVLDPVRVDPAQIVEALVDLAANARDAMPTGGTFTIETTEVLPDSSSEPDSTEEPGAPQVRLSVSDTGNGMDESVLEHLFEPFFTTKPVGQGSGLGLAAVHGIVKQNGGTISVESTPGEGTTFHLDFPRISIPPLLPEPLWGDGFPRGNETVLVIEDDHALRALARTILESCGYVVFDAEGGDQALALARNYPRKIDLLLADVVMPGLSGRQVAEVLRREQPEIKVLYTSGHTDDVILRHGVADASLAFLPKPFEADDLAKAVRRVLDAPAPAS